MTNTELWTARHAVLDRVEHHQELYSCADRHDGILDA